MGGGPVIHSAQVVSQSAEVHFQVR